MALRILGLLPVLMLIACASAGDDEIDTTETEVTLRVSPATVAAGDSVTLALTNQTSLPVGYNLCTSSLERGSGDSWEPVPEDRICTMELRMLDPDSTAERQIQLPADLQGGSYRYTTSVDGRGSMDEVSSQPFQVR